MTAKTYLEPLRVPPLRDVAPLNRGVTFRLPLNAGLTQFWRDQVNEERQIHAPAFLALAVCIAAMLVTTAWEGAHIQSTLRGAVAVFDRQAPPIATVCRTPDGNAATCTLDKPQRISNPATAGEAGLPSIHLNFGVLLP